jgi:hypothetical protein
VPGRHDAHDGIDSYSNLEEVWMRKYLVALGIAAALIGTAVPVAFAYGNGGDNSALGVVRQATRPYRNPDKAIAAGYVQFFGCVHQPLSGSMGIHFVDADLVNDGKIDAHTPEAVIYEQQPNNKLALVGVEYVVFKAAWDAKNPSPPSLFGHTFASVASPNRYGLDPFYALHVWAWKSNPTGSFADWNPAVLCPGAEGHV